MATERQAAVAPDSARRRGDRLPSLGEAEIEAVGPDAVLALGATAARSLFGSSVRVTRDRGRLLETDLAPCGAVTVHPSAILRIRDSEERDDALEGLVEDLELVLGELQRLEK